MGWFDDTIDKAKDVGGVIVKGVDKGTDVLVDKDAWSNTAQAIFDGPGGREVSGEDLVNMLLDSTMLIPGAGVVGGTARVAARVAAKNAAKEGAENIAKKAAVRSLRSPANNAIRDAVKSKTDDAASLFSSKVMGTGGRHAVNRNLTRNGLVTKADGPLKAQLGRIAAKKEAGVGTKIGFGQTRKRVLRNAALTGGANLLTRAYDNGLLNPFGGDEEEGPTGTPAGPGLPPWLSGGGQPGSMYIVGADGSQQEVPKGFMDALAAFMEQNGTVDGSQVIYNK